MRKTSTLYMKREKFKIDCRSLFAVGPVHVKRNVRNHCSDTSMSVIVSWLVSANCADTLTVLG